MKNLHYKVTKIKHMTLEFYRIFHLLSCSDIHFFLYTLFSWSNLQNKIANVQKSESQCHVTSTGVSVCVASADQHLAQCVVAMHVQYSLRKGCLTNSMSNGWK